MEALGSFNGRGSIVQDGNVLGVVGYECNVYDDDGEKVGIGFLAGTADLFVKAMAAPDLTLRLADGQEMGIVITKTIGDDAEFAADGPIPGY